MTEQEIIEEMRNDVSKFERECRAYCKGRRCHECNLQFAKTDCHNQYIAEKLYNEGYRKERQGEWKFRVVRRRICDINHAITCSNCGFDIEMLQGKRYNYCPNCGAKMKGVE